MVSSISSKSVQKYEGAGRRRGRPRAYDPEQALQRALEVFWTFGFAATSLDDIVAATGMNRPSLYAAFGDKHSLYLRALEQYQAWGVAELRRLLSAEGPLPAVLTGVYDAAIALYQSGERARGCFVVGTATTEAASDSDVRAMLAESTGEFDRAFEARFIKARDAGELSADADTAALAALACATLHTIAIRARAGIGRNELHELARKAVGVICKR